jgi:hypothetical protein
MDRWESTAMVVMNANTNRQLSTPYPAQASAFNASFGIPITRYTPAETRSMAALPVNNVIDIAVMIAAIAMNFEGTTT